MQISSTAHINRAVDVYPAWRRRGDAGNDPPSSLCRVTKLKAKYLEVYSDVTKLKAKYLEVYSDGLKFHNLLNFSSFVTPDAASTPLRASASRNADNFDVETLRSGTTTLINLKASSTRIKTKIRWRRIDWTSKFCPDVINHCDCYWGGNLGEFGNRDLIVSNFVCFRRK
ncbi:hypothetical protein QE152_g13 [Popillia japonica]|uniref:Uncharacterized protein n=1 Tax=Popillia japonica TaxID=7064 RepID=A0AAW1NDT4_POPJA